MKRYETKYTQKAIRAMVANGTAQDLTNTADADLYFLQHSEGGMETIGYSHGTYGLNGLLLKGRNTGTLYAVTARCSALFVLY